MIRVKGINEACIYAAIMIFFALISAPFSFSIAQETVGAENEVIRVVVQASRDRGNLPHIWNGVMGDLGMVLNPEGNHLLRTVAGLSPVLYYRRAMGMLNTGIGFPPSTNVYHIDSNGSAFYDFALFDQIFDAMTDAGTVPFVCVSFVPESLSAAPAEGRSAWDAPDRYPPRDYDRWFELIREVVRHCVERYGRENVLAWKWEIWNEPDLEFFWHGSEEEYFKLYDYTAAAVKDVLPEASVGGNGEAGAGSERGSRFLTAFIEHCLRGANLKTGGTGAPLDFISFHVKGGGSQKQGNITSDSLLARSAIPDRNPAFGGMLAKTEKILSMIAGIDGTEGIPVFITECDIDFGVSTSKYHDPRNEYRNTEYFAAFQCALATEMLKLRERYPDNLIEGMIMDTFYFPAYRIFEGRRTLMTAGGIEKPVLNALRLLGKLGRERIACTIPDGAGVDGIAARSGDAVQIMLYNFNEDTRYDRSREVDITINPGNGSKYRVTHYRIDGEHSNSHAVWQSMGAPVVPNEKQLQLIAARQGLSMYEPPRILTPADGQVRFPLMLPPHSVSLLILEPFDGEEQ